MEESLLTLHTSVIFKIYSKHIYPLHFNTSLANKNNSLTLTNCIKNIPSKSPNAYKTYLIRISSIFAGLCLEQEIRFY